MLNKNTLYVGMGVCFIIGLMFAIIGDKDSAMVYGGNAIMLLWIGASVK